MTSISPYAEKEYTVFLVRPWHSPSASLYPHMMDGVEYINEVIRVMKRFLGPQGFEVRVDEDVFIPGLTLRENLHREIFDADLVLVLLDGLRPNVVYELGFAYGWHQFRRKSKTRSEDEKAAEVPSIVCFAERNATVLVRNLYPDPMAVPTLNGETAQILNPRLDLCKMFSDNSDLLVSYYDRLNLIGSVENELDRLVRAIRSAKSKQSIIRDLPLDEPTPVNAESAQVAKGENDWWQLYEQGRFVDVVDRLQKPKDFGQRKVLALSLMKLGRLYESIGIWNQLLDDTDESHSAGVLLHLGICYYAVGELSNAENYFVQARDAGDARADRYLERIRRRSQRRTPPSTNSDTGNINNPPP
jgi:hypothetical protein